MTSTREQLELAAKAAGIEATGYDDFFGIRFLNGSDEAPYSDYWNPLTDRGQLHDLAMACEIDIMPSSDEIEYFTRTKYGGTQRCGKFVDCQDFPALAEAVITAAAEQQQAKETKE